VNIEASLATENFSIFNSGPRRRLSNPDGVTWNRRSR
jgi:hypothetical protein